MYYITCEHFKTCKKKCFYKFNIPIKTTYATQGYCGRHAFRETKNKLINFIPITKLQWLIYKKGVSK